jgi:E3 ubiquitin-protein ligase TRIP12
MKANGDKNIARGTTVDFDMWVDDLEQEGEYIMNPIGLFPSPLPIGHEATEIVCKRFRLIGRLVGRALMDEQILPLPLSYDFLRLVLGESIPITRLPHIFVDSPTRGNLILELLSISEDDIGNDSANKRLQRQLSAELYMEDMVTGTPLIADGNDILVNESNYIQYTQLMHKFLCNDGTFKQVNAFKQGLNDVGTNVLPKLKMFSEVEIRQLICGAETIDWTEDEIFECINAEHGYQKDSKEVRDLIFVLCEFNQTERRSFLTFLTGCPHLPAGGLKHLEPQICVYKKKPSDEVGDINDALTSSRTCRNQLHLPPYSNAAIMRKKLKQSMEESLGAIDLA